MLLRSSARHASMLRVDATTMRCRRCSGKFRAVHIDVTTLLTFQAALRVIVGGQISPAERRGQP
jgi:hypothetical protein